MVNQLMEKFSALIARHSFTLRVPRINSTHSRSATLSPTQTLHSTLVSWCTLRISDQIFVRISPTFATYSHKTSSSCEVITITVLNGEKSEFWKFYKVLTMMYNIVWRWVYGLYPSSEE
jgi:hypothetical protein